MAHAFVSVAASAVGSMAQKGIHMMYDQQKREERKKITKDLEYKINKHFRNLKNKIEDLLKEHKKLEGYTLDDIQPFKAEIEKNQGMKKEKERTQALKFRLKKNVKQLSRRILTLEAEVQDWPENMKYELLIRREALNSFEEIKEENIALALEAILRRNMREFLIKIESLEEDLLECNETIKHEIQIFRGELEEYKQGMKKEDIASTSETLLKNMQEFSQTIDYLKIKIEEYLDIINYEIRIFTHEMRVEDHGKKEEDIASALETLLKNNKDIYQKMETLKVYVEECMKTINHEIQILRDEQVEKKQGNKEEDIALTAEKLLINMQVFSQTIEILKEDVKGNMQITIYELQILRDELKEKNQEMKEDIKFVVEPMVKMTMQLLCEEIGTLKDDVKKCMETINHELQILRDELEEKKQGKIEADISLAQETLLKKNKQEFSKKIETLKEHLEECMEKINYELQILRDELKDKKQEMKKEKECAHSLESRLKRKVRQFNRRIQTLQEDAEEWPETIMLEIQVRRGVLKNIKGMKKEDIALALEIMLKKNKREFSQKIETLKEDVEECMETINHELQILRDELEEKKQGKDKQI